MEGRKEGKRGKEKRKKGRRGKEERKKGRKEGRKGMQEFNVVNSNEEEKWE